MSTHLTSLRGSGSSTNTTLGFLLLGDFNQHYPLWDNPSNHHLFTPANTAAAQPLLNILAMYDLQMTLLPFIPMLYTNVSKNYTRPNNVFCTDTLTHAITCCEVEEHLMPVNMDHFPILTDCTITPELTNLPPRCNFHMMDWEKFATEFGQCLQQLPHPTPITTVEAAETCIQLLSDAIAGTITEVVPTSKPSPFTKQWWSHELERDNKCLKALARTAKGKRHIRDHPIHKEHNKVRNTFAKQVEKVKIVHWQEYLEEVDQHSIWNMLHGLRNQ